MESTSFISLKFYSLLFLFLTHVTASNSIPTFPKRALPTKTGYLPVIPASKSAIYFTFYEAQTSKSPLSKTPLIIWLQGGPGSSSMIGNFFELGPWRVSSGSLTLEPNPGAWNRIFGLLFLDNPIGTGFSIASKLGEIPRDQISVAKHLFAAITKFIELHPDFKTRPIYITGESYAGKYVPAIGYYILKMNEKFAVSQRLNLAGVAVGDGLTDPVTQVATHAMSAYYAGLINERQKIELENIQLEAIRLTQIENWTEARNARNRVFRTLYNMTGLATSFDYTKKVPYRTHLVDQLLNFGKIKKLFGVDESLVFKSSSDVVKDILGDDVMKSVKFMAEYLVKNSKVLLYQGQYDLSDGVLQVEAWVKTMIWEGIVDYLNADRKIWEVNGELAGYVQKWKSLTNVVVLGAGHLLPADQPVSSQAMIEDWILERGVFGS